MSRTWFSRRNLKCRGESLDIEVNSYANATVLQSQIFTTNDLVRSQNAAPITLDGGAAVTTMTIRGVSALPANYKVEVSTFTVNLPAFSVTAVSAGTITTITLGQTIKKPQKDTVYSIPLSTGSALVTGKVSWSATTGNLTLSKIDGSAITVNFGLTQDVVLAIN